MGHIQSSCLIALQWSNMRIARQLSAPNVRRLSPAWAAVSEDRIGIEDSSPESINSSWHQYVIGHAENGLRNKACIAWVCSGSTLGSAMLCQQTLMTPSIFRTIALITGEDHAAAHSFIQCTRGKILCELKSAFRELVMAEQYFYRDDSYYNTRA